MPLRKRSPSDPGQRPPSPIMRRAGTLVSYSHPSRCHAPSVDAATPVELEVSGPLLSHRLAVLRDAGIITATRRGRWIDDTLDPDALGGLAELIAARGTGVDR